MKICLVSDYLVGYHKNWSGAEMVCKILAELLWKENQEVFFLTTKFKKKETLDKIYQIPVLTGRSGLLKKILIPFYLVWGIFFATCYLKKIKPDIVNFLHSNYLFVPVMLAAKILRIPAVFTFLDYYMICPRATFKTANGEICESLEGNICLRCISKIKYIERILLRILKNKLDGVITFTETSKKRLIKHGFPEDRIKIVYTYNIPPEFSNKRVKAMEKNSVLVIASFNEHKGLHIALRAFSRVLSEIPSAKLKVIGQGNAADTERINKLTKELDIATSVDFLGQKSNEDVLEAILESEVIVVPEQWPSEFGPLALVEAMALGRPAVGSNIGSIPDFVKDGINGFLARYDSPEDFAAKIVRLLKNKEAAGKMGETAKEAGKILFSHEQGKETVKFFQYLIEAK